MVVNTRFIVVALMFIGFDIVTGILAAIFTGHSRSNSMWVGGCKKLFLIVVICFGVMLDYAQYLANIGINVPALECICGYIAIMEILSIIENINRGFPNALPKALTSILEKRADELGVPTKETEEDAEK